MRIFTIYNPYYTVYKCYLTFLYSKTTFTKALISIVPSCIGGKAAYGKSDVMIDKEKFKDIHGN